MLADLLTAHQPFSRHSKVPIKISITRTKARAATRKPLDAVRLLPGLQAGGISPLALINKGFQVLIDSSAHALGEIHVSGGQRGLNIRLPVDALAKLVNARFAEVCCRE